ncbi:hypothetical protein GCM10009133_36890 [Cocleimonas flava]|uniref:Uncharacterized protein DUF481 n=1 Tax=Cocleimonas flava TaxID=634765 RepID=A0A4R1FCG7_9GAMM|nr:DUF481 domain-containing protein [Cocleimonas flava]TCJ88471.1 uncharacterized protein DUF481 [Cocleimonas flava]
MNKLNILGSAIALGLTGAFTSAHAEPLITDYKEATSAYEDAYVSGNFNSNDGNQDQASYNLDLTLDYEKVFSSPNRNTKIDFLGTGSSAKGGNEGDKSSSTYQALGSATVDNYFTPNSNAAFWYGKGEVGIQKDQEDPFTKATAGIGYGRVVNVTPMAYAIRIMQKLREEGFLKADPSNDIYQQVAVIVDKESEYKSKYGLDDYKQYWLQDIQKVIETSGMVQGDFNARAVVQTYDVLENERVSTRKNGWLVRAGVGAVLSNYDGSDGKPALEVGAEYHRPINNKTQFSNEAIATATLDDDDNGYNFNNAMSLTYELSDLIDWENKWTLAYATSDDTDDVTTNTLSSAFYYSLTNQLDFGVEGKLTKLDDSISNNGNDEVDKSLTMGVKYRLK